MTSSFNNSIVSRCLWWVVTLFYNHCIKFIDSVFVKYRTGFITSVNKKKGSVPLLVLNSINRHEWFQRMFAKISVVGTILGSGSILRVSVTELLCHGFSIFVTSLARSIVLAEERYKKRLKFGNNPYTNKDETSSFSSMLSLTELTAAWKALSKLVYGASFRIIRKARRFGPWYLFTLLIVFAASTGTTFACI